MGVHALCFRGRPYHNGPGQGINRNIWVKSATAKCGWRALSWPAGRRAGWAAPRRCGFLAANRCWRMSIARARPQVIGARVERQRRPRPVSRRSACRFWRIRCPGLPGRLPAFSPGWIGRRAPGSIHSPASPAMRRSFRSIWSARLAEARDREGAAIASPRRAGGSTRCSRFGRWNLREELRRALTVEGARKVDAWAARYRLATVPFASGPVRSVFQHQYAGGSGDGGDVACHAALVR